METIHNVYITDSRKLSVIADKSVDLVVTSPPYPMIKMWDELFSDMSKDIKECLLKEKGDNAFELMHQELDKVWKELYRITKEGSFICINIGDAARTVGKRFQLYSNHSRIISSMKEIGFNTLPIILWRKQTNAPNKFMGSGMLPSGAYVTLEHEYILIFRKGDKRKFCESSEKKKRMESSFFWEERNTWFSDIWDFKGTSQNLNHDELRKRSAAYPFELAYRLINMYSLKEDTVFDPFLGTGTTTHASIACGRNSIGVEIDKKFSQLFFNGLDNLKNISNQLTINRIKAHISFTEAHKKNKGEPKYINYPHNISVITKQETEIIFNELVEIIKKDEYSAKAIYKPLGQFKNKPLDYIISRGEKYYQPSLFT